MNPPSTAYDTRAKHLAFYDQVFEKASALPGRAEGRHGIGAAAERRQRHELHSIEGRPAPRIAVRNAGDLVSAGQRELLRHDGDDDPPRPRRSRPREAMPSVVVNESLVKKFFPGEEPLGQAHPLRLMMARGSPSSASWRTRKFAARGKRRRSRHSSPTGSSPNRGWRFCSRPASHPEQLASPLAAAVASIDRNVPVPGISTLAEIVSDSIEQPRFFALLVGRVRDPGAGAGGDRHLRRHGLRRGAADH